MLNKIKFTPYARQDDGAFVAFCLYTAETVSKPMFTFGQALSLIAAFAVVMFLLEFFISNLLQFVIILLCGAIVCFFGTIGAFIRDRRALATK